MLAKAAGLKVAATARSYNLEYVGGLGADYAIDYRSATAVEEIFEALEEKGVFAGAFAAVMGREVYVACTEVCVKLGGKQVVSLVQPPFMPFEEELPGGVQVAYSESLPLEVSAVWLALRRAQITDHSLSTTRSGLPSGGTGSRRRWKGAC